MNGRGRRAATGEAISAFFEARLAGMAEAGLNIACLFTV
jgi:hypothetical protein